MQVENIKSTRGFGARWSKALLKEVASMRKKNPHVFNEIKKLHKGATISREADGWYRLNKKNSNTPIYIIPSDYDYARGKYFGIDLKVVEYLKRMLEKIK